MKTKLVTSLMLVMAMLAALVGPVLAQGDEPPDWDRSSISVSARCDGNDAVFTIVNGGSGNMAGPSTYTLSNGGGGSFGPLASGASTEIRVASNGVKIEIVVYQGPGDPGAGQAKADATCGSTAPTPTNTPTNTPPPPPTNTPTPTATNTLDPNENSASVQPSVNCDGDWNLNLWASAGAVVTGETLGNLGTGSVHYNVDVTFSNGDLLSFHFEGDLNYPEECGEDNTPTPTNTTPPDQPTGTPTPTPTATPVRGCDDPLGRWTLHGVIKDVDGNVLAVPGGNFYHIFFRQVRLEDGVVTAELGTLHFPVFDNGTWGGGGYLPVQNVDRTSVTVMDSSGKIYPAQAYSIHSQTKERLVDQQQYIGTYCAEMWLEVVISLDGEPLPPPPAEQPTPAPLQNTGAGGAGGLLAFGGLLALLAAVIGGVSFGLGAKKR